MALPPRSATGSPARPADQRGQRADDGTSPGRSTPPLGDTKQVVRLAIPAAVSYLFNNVYRMNDQFWVQGLGGPAQAALGASFYVAILNFALMFLAAAGALSLVARATGAGDRAERDSIARHAIFFAGAIGLGLTLVGNFVTPTIVGWLGLEGELARLAEEYLSMLYLVAVPMALVPAIDNVFIGLGNTLVPMLLISMAVLVNYAFNPLLIYGGDAAGRPWLFPGMDTVARLAAERDFHGFGVGGAALATGLSRLVTGVLGLAILRFVYGVRLLGSLRPKLARLRALTVIGVPMSASIAVYSLVYLVLVTVVLSRLDEAVLGGLGIGFQVFEGISYPLFLGLSVAGASLVGRALGSGDGAAVWRVVRNTRRVGAGLGVAGTLFFLALGPLIAPAFTEDPAVLRETLAYVFVLAFSQYAVAVEAVNEKLLLGAGKTRPIFWIGATGNLVRIPLAYLLALPFGFGAVGVWWAINLTTYYKAAATWWVVHDGGWTDAPQPRA